MGKPGWRQVQSLLPEYIGQVEGTRGSETSQYPQEEKTTVIPLVVASETGPRLNLRYVIAGRRCTWGVVGPDRRLCRVDKESQTMSEVEADWKVAT